MEFRIFDKETDLDQQRKLFKECFPENDNTSVEKKSHYSWKFHSFPSYPQSYEYGAFSEGDLIGYYAAIPYQYVVDKEIIEVGMVCDVMTGVKARGKGVFTKMGKYSTQRLKEKKVAFSIGYPIRPEVIPGHMKAGWEKSYHLPLYMKFMSLSTLLKTKKIGFLSPIADLFLNIYNKLVTLPTTDKVYNLLRHSSQNINEIEGLDVFLNSWIAEHQIALNKNSDFLNWRLGAPEKEYSIVVARKDQKIVGYAVVCNTVKENVPCIAILDISLLSGYKGLSSSIFREINFIANENKAEAIIIMASQTLANRYKFMRNGFLKSPFKFTLIIKNLQGKYSNEFLKDEKNWHLTWIDSDDL